MSGEKFESQNSEQAESLKQRKTYQEKAVERGYYQDENGDWWQGSGDGFDERVDNFKLDEKYPDLADKTEVLAEKYGARYSDFGDWGLKGAIYRNAERLSLVDDTYLEDVFRVSSRIAGLTRFRGGDVDEIALSYDGFKLAQVADSLDVFYEQLGEMLPGELASGKVPSKVGGVADYLVAYYDEGMQEGDFLKKLSEYTARAYEDDKNGHQMFNDIERGIVGIHDNGSGWEHFDGYMQYCTKMLDGQDKKVTEYITERDILAHYVGLHGVSERTIPGFKEIVFPLVERRDAEAEPFFLPGNSWGMGAESYGITDYTAECLLSGHEPAEINKLMRIYHEIPTSDYQKFEQNRKDAARLQDTIIGGRDFIHDELPGVHELLSAMEEYYDHRDGEDVEIYAERVRRLGEEFLSERGYRVLSEGSLDIETYERPVEYMAEGYSQAAGGEANERAIDILRRLVKNTAPDLAEAPITKYPVLDEALGRIRPRVNEKTGVVSVSLAEVGPAVTEMNKILIENYGEQGVMPSTVLAVTFLDKMSAYALRRASHKDVLELTFDPNFKEIVRFSQLTSSVGYNEAEFEADYQKILTQCSRGYGGESVDADEIGDGYRLLSQKIFRNMEGLAGYYRAKEVTSRFSEAIWSGNLADELIGLFQRV